MPFRAKMRFFSVLAPPLAEKKHSGVKGRLSVVIFRVLIFILVFNLFSNIAFFFNK